jgi:hypothetical protein
MGQLILLFGAALGAFGLVRWYRHTEVVESEATVHLQSEHEHFHLHVDLPPDIQIQPGDTLEILSMPELDEGRTEGGEVIFNSPVRLQKASWLQRNLIKNSSLVEVSELVDHP